MVNRKENITKEANFDLQEENGDLEKIHDDESNNNKKKKKHKKEKHVEVLEEKGNREKEMDNETEDSNKKKKKHKKEKYVTLEETENKENDWDNETEDSNKKKKKHKKEKHAALEEKDMDNETKDSNKKKKKKKKEKNMALEETENEEKYCDNETEDSNKKKKRKDKKEKNMALEETENEEKDCNNETEDSNNKNKKKKKNKKEKQVADLEETENKEKDRDNETKDSNTNKKKKSEKMKNKKDGDSEKKKAKKEKRKREDEKDSIDCKKRTKKTKKESNSHEGKKEKDGKKVAEEEEKKKGGKRVRFSGKVEVFSLQRENEERKNNDNEEQLVRGKRFTKEEDEIVLKAVDDYIKVHQLGDQGREMVLNARKYKVVGKCWDEIGTCIAYRPKMAIYERARTLLTKRANHRWTPEEYETVRKYKEQHGNKWQAFADQYNINRKAVKDAWRRIRLPNNRKGPWSQEEYQTLFDLVNIDLKVKAFGKRKTMHGMLRDNIAWEAISDKLGTRIHTYCCDKWYDQLSSTMVKEGYWLDTDDYRLIESLQSSDATCEEEVEWDQLLHHREGEICRKRWQQMVRHIGDNKEKSFLEKVEVLAKRYCPDLLEYRMKYNGEKDDDLLD